MPTSSDHDPDEPSPRKLYSGAWAKLTPDAALPLADHGADVAAVMNALLEGGWQARLEGIAERPLSARDRDVLLALSFVHDLGKCNRGFWARQLPNAPLIGHTSIVLVLEDMRDPWPRLGALAHLVASAGVDFLMAMLAHHGAPVAPPPTGLGSKRYWQMSEQFDPIDELARLMSVAAARFPLAFEETGSGISLTPRAVSLYAGLLTLADWIGSDTNIFPIDGVTGAARARRSVRRARERITALGLAGFDHAAMLVEKPTFERSFEGNTPYESQTSCGRTDLGSLTILEAETGSGKTEAALWRFLQLLADKKVDGLYFALPTRTSAVQIHTRIQAFLDRTFGDDAPRAVLAVPGYLKAGHSQGTVIGPFETQWPDDRKDLIEDATWSAETPKRFLSARVAVGTVDQAMLAGLRTRHAHLRAATLVRSLLVVDEVHASDPYMTEVLAGVIDNHRKGGGHVLLLSATLGASARTRFLSGRNAVVPSFDAACRTPYPALHDEHGEPHATASNGRTKEIALTLLPFLDDPNAIARVALDAAADGARVLIVRNTVKGAIEVLSALESSCGSRDERLFMVDGIVTLHHGRFAGPDRRRLDESIETAFGKDRASTRSSGVIGVGTQTLEISLDLDADLLLTDLAPMDVLLQRFGRLHRHVRSGRPTAFDHPQAIVLVPEHRDLTPYLGRMVDRHGIGPVNDGQGGIYANLPAVEATWRQLEAHASLSIPDQNRTLVERATHPDEWETIERELGWNDVGIKRDGVLLNDRRLARDHGLDLSVPFADLELFPDDDEAVRTRLGDSARLVQLDPPLPGPFGQVIETVTVPAWMAGGEPVDIAAMAVPIAGGFTFDLGARRFTYDRFGLQRTDEEI